MKFGCSVDATGDHEKYIYKEKGEAIHDSANGLQWQVEQKYGCNFDDVHMDGLP